MPNYTYGSGQCLKNRFGIQDAAELETIEVRFVAARLAEIGADKGPVGAFDARHLRAIHHHLFQDVYEWAGHTRDEIVRLSDGTGASEPLLRKAGSQLFLPGSHVRPALGRIRDDLRRANYLRDRSRAEFAAAAADVMLKINDVHPFREGNGRAQRVFIGQLAAAAGHELDFSVVSQERMVSASIAGHDHQDPAMMRRLLVEIGDPERVAALRTAIGFFDRQRFAWNDRYLATAEPGHAVDLTMVDIAGGHFMGRTTKEILIGQVADIVLPHARPGEVFTVTPGFWASANENTAAAKPRAAEPKFPDWTTEVDRQPDDEASRRQKVRSNKRSR